MYQCTRYGGPKEQVKVLIVSPHGSDGSRFLETYPEILQHEAVDKHRAIFDLYLSLEQDRGATELAHHIAEFLQSQKVPSKVFEMDYPRGLLDGGRSEDHCLRNALPPDLREKLADPFRAIHRKTLNRVKELYQLINGNGGVLLDIHTMASFSPMKDGRPLTQPESFPSIYDYCRQFIEAPKNMNNIRHMDLITEDGKGHCIGSEELRDFMIQELEASAITFRENDPYSALPHFLMNTHLSYCEAIAIDVPKHLVSTTEDPLDFHLENFVLDMEKIRLLGTLIGRATLKALNVN